MIRKGTKTRKEWRRWGGNGTWELGFGRPYKA